MLYSLCKNKLKTKLYSPKNMTHELSVTTNPKQGEMYTCTLSPIRQWASSLICYHIWSERAERKRYPEKREGCEAERWREAWTIVVFSCGVKFLYKPCHYSEPWSSCCFKSVTHQRWADRDVGVVCPSMNEVDTHTHTVSIIKSVHTLHTKKQTCWTHMTLDT